MIVYEARIVVDEAVVPDYREWIGPHVREILAIPGFSHAELHVEDDPGHGTTFVTRFHLDSRATLERYLVEHAPRLRAETAVRFGDRIRGTRRVTELVESFRRER